MPDHSCDELARCREPEGCRLSDDYEHLLALLRMPRAVLCHIQHPEHFPTAALAWRQQPILKHHPDRYLVRCVGATFVDAITTEEFVEQCRASKVRYVVPSDCPDIPA